jgi:hypothetical protein
MVIFISVALILVYSIFYRLLHDRFNRLASTSSFHKFVKLFHFGVLGLLTLLYFVRIILTIVIEAKTKNHTLDYKLQEHSQDFSAALDIISWLAALEILACSVLVLIQSRSSLGGSIVRIILE